MRSHHFKFRLASCDPVVFIPVKSPINTVKIWILVLKKKLTFHSTFLRKLSMYFMFGLGELYKEIRLFCLP